ncbi:MAG: hypothetical protein ABIQ99_00780 [Thermoflexales bacterium]
MPVKAALSTALAFALAGLPIAALRPVQAAVRAPATTRLPSTLTPRAFLPWLAVTAVCPTTSSTVFDLVPIEGAYYKNNALTDENADFRLSILGYAPSLASLSLVDYIGETDLDAPKFNGMFAPNRTPAIRAAYQVYGWNWADGVPNPTPPYGTRGGVNNSWAAHVIDLTTTPGETLQIPERSVVIWTGNNVALVLYASETEVTFAYARNDSVMGYVVHMLNLCVNPALVAAYRAQLNGAGRRATGHLPGLKVGQTLGTARAGWVTVAIRDTGAYMDPRSRKDWWP